MKVSLLIVTKNEITNGMHVFETTEREFELDNSLACQIRWEARFPELAKAETFVDYAVRVGKEESKNAAVVLAKMKVVYCLFDTPMSFVQFVKLFDFTRIDYVEELCARLKEIFEIVLESSSEKN